MLLNEIYEEIKNAQNICILAHENPDGDAIGSCLGLYHVLNNMGKNAVVLLKNAPETYRFLQGYDEIVEESDIENFDIAIVLDCQEIKRVNQDLRKYIENANVKIEFDHHTKNSMFADYCVVNSASPACAQTLIESLEYLEIEIPKEAFECFMTGIITDTNGFRNSDINEDTFEIAEEALARGINVSNLYKKSLLTISKSRFEAQKLAMDRLELIADGKIAFTYLNKEDFKNLGLKDGDHEGIVDMELIIEGIEVAIFLREEEKGYKISLRSNQYANVADICAIFGGGGHIRAAGANTTLSLEEAKTALIREITKRLK